MNNIRLLIPGRGYAARFLPPEAFNLGEGCQQNCAEKPANGIRKEPTPARHHHPASVAAAAVCGETPLAAPGSLLVQVELSAGREKAAVLFFREPMLTLTCFSSFLLFFFFVMFLFLFLFVFVFFFAFLFYIFSRACA